MQQTSTNILESSTKQAFDVLPDSTKTKYEGAYDLYSKWRQRMNITAPSSEEVLLAYFTELSEKCKPSTLAATYSMMKTTLSIHENIQMNTYIRLQRYLRKNAAGFKSKKTLTFTGWQILKFIEEAPDEIYLPTKVALIFSVMGNIQLFELHMMMVSDVFDNGKALVVKVPNKKNKKPQTFTITSQYFCNICRLYISDRPKTQRKYVFLQYKKGKITSPWQRMGVNSYCKMGKHIAVFLKLPNSEEYTGHSMRKSMISFNAVGEIVAYQRQAEAMTTTEDNQHSEAVEKAFEFIGLLNTENTTNVPDLLIDHSLDKTNQRFSPSSEDPTPDCLDFDEHTFDDMPMDHSNAAPIEVATSPLDIKPNIESLDIEITAPALVEYRPPNPIAQSKPVAATRAAPVQSSYGAKLCFGATQDEFHLFAMAIASQLRNMPLKSALRTQSKIQQIVTEERITSYNSS